jgi:hypothetical protein
MTPRIAAELQYEHHAEKKPSEYFEPALFSTPCCSHLRDSGTYNAARLFGMKEA